MSKSASAKWTAGLDQKKVQRAFEEAVVDCYNESEQHSGLLTLIEDEVQFPFPACVLGETVQVVGME